MTRSTPARVVVSLAVALAAAAGGCTQIGTSPTVVTALQFDTLPFPALVTGDTLRDSLGAVAPLRATAFNGAGGVIPSASLTYLALDSGLTIDPAGIVTAQLRNGRVRVVASAPGLQSVAETLTVARRPDSLFATSALVDTLLYVLPDNASANVSPSLGLKLATRDTAGGISGTQGWVVAYQLFFHGNALATTDTAVASLWNAGGRPALKDTTASGGTSSRVVRVRPAGLPTVTESVTVVASVHYRGAPVPGSPVTFVIQIRPK